MLIVSLVTLGMLLSAITFVQLRSVAGNNRSSKDSLQRLATLRELMWLFQTHRGKSIAWLSGDKNVVVELRNLQSRIQLDIKKLNSSAKHSSKNSNWQATQLLWTKVASQWRDGPVEMSFKLHNALIKQHMFAMEDEITCLESRQVLIREGGYSQFSSSLLNMIEFMGQTRAIGTSVTSSGKCQSIAKIRLCYLSQKLQSSVQQVKGQDADFKQREKLIAPVVSCVKENLLPAHNLMSTKDWFALCTESIDALYAYFDQTLCLTGTKN